MTHLGGPRPKKRRKKGLGHVTVAQALVRGYQVSSRQFCCYFVDHLVSAVHLMCRLEKRCQLGFLRSANLRHSALQDVGQGKPHVCSSVFVHVAPCSVQMSPAGFRHLA